MSLNQSQKMAVCHKDGPALVLAGPGSGKTMVITHRIKELIDTYGAAPGEILVITFTRAAAAEMKTRFDALMGGRRLPVTFGTFHSVYFRILKYAYHYDASQIIGEEARLRLLSEELSDLEPTMAEESMDVLQEILGEISSVKNDMLSLEHYYAKSCSAEMFSRLFQAYEKRLRKENVIDFDDMLMLCYELFKARPDILSGWQRKYKYILCDEFQDINRIQYEILKLLALPENNLFIVGDDDQAIYRFRGARPELMLGFPREFREAKRYLLGINYRCPDPVIKAAGNLIACNHMRFQKEISGTKKSGGPVILGTFPAQAEENKRIIDHIRAYHDAGIPYEEMAVLVRINTGARSLAGKLMEYNIPFQTRDMVPSLYTHWICGDLTAYLRAAMGEQTRDQLLRIINKPCRYIARSAFLGGETTLDQLEAMYEEKPWIARRVAQLSEDLKILSRRSPYEAVTYIRKQIGYDDYLREYAKERNLTETELFTVLEELHADAGEHQTALSWFSHMERYKQEMKRQQEKQGREGTGVVLSTMHRAKGLEYRIVFLPDANEGVIPYEKAEGAADLEEERRLFYVAMTRAAEKLHIYSVKELYGRASAASRFVRELKGTNGNNGNKSRSETAKRPAVTGKPEQKGEL